MPTCLSKITQIFFPFQDVNPLPENTLLFCLQSFHSILLFVNNKAKGRISKGDKKTKHAKFSEKDQFLPPDTYTYVCMCVYQGVKNVRFFSEIWRTLFSCSLRFESCLSTMLPTTSNIQGTSKSPPVTNFPIDAVVQDRVNEYNVDFIILLTFQLHMVIFDRDNFFFNLYKKLLPISSSSFIKYLY